MIPHTVMYNLQANIVHTKEGFILVFSIILQNSE